MKHPEFQDIQLRRDGAVGIVQIDRGDGRNALRPQTLREICVAFDVLNEDHSVRAILLASTGKHFSAGADFEFLQDLTTMPAIEIRDQIYRAFQGAARRIYNSSKPTVAAVRGAAITVGCELALACDFRVIGPTAQFQESWIKLGLIPPLGGLFLLPSIIGLGMAKEMVLTGRPVGAEESLRCGLATRLVGDGEMLDLETMTFAVELTQLPPLAYRAAKEGLHRGLESSMEKEWAANVLAQSLLLGTDDFREGLSAVRDRRPPRFEGR